MDRPARTETPVPSSYYPETNSLSGGSIFSTDWYRTNVPRLDLPEGTYRVGELVRTEEVKRSERTDDDAKPFPIPPSSYEIPGYFGVPISDISWFHSSAGEIKYFDYEMSKG